MFGGSHSHCLPTQHQLNGFYNRDRVCLLRGTVRLNIIHNCNLISVLKGLIPLKLFTLKFSLANKF